MKTVQPSLGRRLGKPDRRQLRVLYQDDAVVVLNKPAKMLAVPTDDSDLPSALSLLSAELEAKRQRAFVVHRIDRDTSGILLFAKTWPDREALVAQFIQHTPVREYLAVVRGHLRLKEETLVHHFRQEGMFQKVTTASDPKSARAELRYSVEHRLKGASLVRVSLVTGLQNQIRVQLSAIGHPVIWIGRLIGWLDRTLNREDRSGAQRKAMGFVALLVLIAFLRARRSFANAALALIALCSLGFAGYAALRGSPLAGMR